MGPNGSANCPPSFSYFDSHKPISLHHNSAPSLDEIVKTLASSTFQFQQETRTSIKNLETQVSQLANIVERMETQGSGKLPSQTVVDLKEIVSVITLRGGK